MFTNWSVPLLGLCTPTFEENNDTVLTVKDYSNRALWKKITNEDLKDIVKRLSYLMTSLHFGQEVFRDLAESWWLIVMGLLSASNNKIFWALMINAFCQLLNINHWLSIGRRLQIINAQKFGRSNIHLMYWVKILYRGKPQNI